MSLELNYYKEKSFLIFNLFNALFKTFRGEKDLFNSIEYINKLLKKYKFSIFYLFRIRNLFLYFYQTVIGRKIFYHYMLNDKKKILDSKYMKIIFSDFLKAKKVNEKNNIINLFEGFIYLHLLDKKGVEILNPFLGIPGNEVDLLMSNYYLDIGNLDLAEKILISKKTKKNFKYYRKLFPIYILSRQKNKFLSLINSIVYEKKYYSIKFYYNGSHNNIINNISFDDFLLNNENLNIPLDIDIDTFMNVISSHRKGDNDLNIISKLFEYIRQDHRDYFLTRKDISIILEKNN